MLYEGISWNEDWVRSMTEQAFIDSPMNAERWTQPGFAIPAQQRKKRLRELWRLLNPEKKEVKSADNKQLAAISGTTGLALPVGECPA